MFCLHLYTVKTNKIRRMLIDKGQTEMTQKHLPFHYSRYMTFLYTSLHCLSNKTFLYNILC